MLVIDVPSAGESALQEAAVHPTGASIAGDILAILPILLPRVLFEILEGVLVLEKDILSLDVDGFGSPVALERLANHEGVAGAVGDLRKFDFGVLKENAIVLIETRFAACAKEIIRRSSIFTDALYGILGIETDF